MISTSILLPLLPPTKHPLGFDEWPNERDFILSIVAVFDIRFVLLFLSSFAMEDM